MELKFKGTPWPWEVDECGIITSKKFPYDGIGSLYDDQPTYEANKKLIAAAPELLEVCVKLCAFCTEVATMSQTGDKSGAEEVGRKIGNLYGDAYKAIMKALEE